MNNLENRNFVLTSLNNVAERMRLHRGLVLTESDLKCQVYSELLNIDSFSRVRPSFDNNVSSIAIHTETKFFNEIGLLSQAPDLVITDPGMLSITRSVNGDPLPTKGFNFDGPSILIELKFLKSARRAHAKTLASIRHDINKSELLNRRRLNFHLIVAVFDRFDHNENIIQEIFQGNIGHQNLTCVYFSGGDHF